MRVIDQQLLPAGWQIATLEEILDPTENVDPKNHFEQCFDYIDIEAVDNSNQRIASPKRLPASAAPSRARRKVQRGDVVFSLVRPYLKNIAIVGRELDGAIASTAFFVCRPNPSIDGRFLFNYLRQDSFIEGITTYGDSPPAGHDDEFVRLQIPIAPAREQERIADTLDELLSDLDAGVEALQRAQAKLALYRASVLKAAVQGDLTAEWRKQHPDAEPASVLLQRILVERRQRWEQEQLRKFKAAGKAPPANWKAKYKDPVAPDTTNLPPLPKGWCWATCDQLAWTSGYGTSVKCSESYSGIPVLRIPNISGGVIDLSKIKFAPADYFEPSEETVLPGDLLVVRTNGSRALIGRGAVVFDKPEREYSFASYLIRLRVVPDQSLLAWVSLVWQSAIVRNWVESKAATSAGQYNISLGVLQTMAIPIPPSDEQEAITNLMDQQFTVAEHVQGDLANRFLTASSLRQSILRHAFTGQLVPQDPNDEPASELLKRIASEREARKKTKATPQKQTTKRQKREK